MNLMPNVLTLLLKPGDPAPSFSFVSEGRKLALSDFRGNFVVLYFYPRDDTPGCTKEACGFRDAMADFAQAGAIVIGVSADSERSHARFREKFGLPFHLAADESKEIVRAYGVWGEKRFMGRKYQGIHRVTFLIGPEGGIRHIWTEVKPADHAREVLAALGDLPRTPGLAG